MISRLLLILSFFCCAAIVGSFAFFANDQLAGASLHEQRSLVSGSDAAPAVAPRPPTGFRRTVEEINDRLTAPFRSVIHSNSQWVVRGGEGLIGLLFWGLGLCFIAHYARGSSRSFLRPGRGPTPQ